VPPIAKAGSPGRKPISRISSEPRSDLAFRRKHYGRRKGPKLRARQAGLLESLLPTLALKPEQGRDLREYFAAASIPPCGSRIEKAKGPVDLSPIRTAREEVTDIWLEVGFGAGEHLAWQAETHPELGLIGAEPYVAGMAKLLTRIADKNLRNIRLYTDDVRDVIAAAPDASLGRIFILFPDPWPKARHHKRRFIQTGMLNELARVMRRGAELRFATDDAGYLDWALERFSAHPAFEWMALSGADWRVRPHDWPETRYEVKAVRAARKCGYLRFVRT
jgi:tRNA (guanine-N7-)-methyltransferase